MQPAFFCSGFPHAHSYDRQFVMTSVAPDPGGSAAVAGGRGDGTGGSVQPGTVTVCRSQCHCASITGFRVASIHRTYCKRFFWRPLGDWTSI